MTIEQMEKAKKEEKQSDKKKRKRKARESWRHFRHNDIELFKLGKEQQKPIYPKLQNEKQIFAQNVEKAVAKTKLKSLVNANPNNKSLEQICETLQNRVNESADDDNNLTIQTNEESDKPEKGQLRVFLKQAKNTHEYEIVFNKAVEVKTNETAKSNPLEQASLSSQYVGRHNLPIQITERRRSIAEPLTRIISQNPKIPEDIIKPQSIKESIPLINSSLLDNRKTDQNPVSTPLLMDVSNKNAALKNSNQQNVTTLCPLNGILQTHKTVDEPCNLSLSKTTPKSMISPEPNFEKQENRKVPKKQPRRRACAGTRAKKQNVTQKGKNNTSTVEHNQVVPPVSFQNGNFFPAQHTLPQLNNTCLPQRRDEISYFRTNSISQDNVPDNNLYYRRLQVPQTKRTLPHSFYPINPFKPPIQNINFPCIYSEETPTAENYRQKKTLEESFCQRPYLSKESNIPHNMYALPRPPVSSQIEQERQLLSSLDILNNYRSMNLNNAASSNPITEHMINQASINLMHSLQDKNNNGLSLFSSPFKHNFPIAPHRLNNFPILESTRNTSNSFHQREHLNNNTKSTTSIPEPITTHAPSGNHFSAMRNSTPTDVSLMHHLYRQDFSKPPPYSEKPVNPPPYSDAVKSRAFSNDQAQPTNFMCGLLTPPSSSLDVLEISEEHDNSRRCITSKPVHPTVSHTSTSTITDIDEPIIDFPTPNEEIPQPILQPTRYNIPQKPISLSNLPRDSVIKPNFSILNSTRTTNSSAGVTTHSGASILENAIKGNSKTEETKKLKEISTQTDLTIDSISPTTTGKVQEEESIKTTKRKFSEDTKDEILNKLKALSSNPILTTGDENKISSNRLYENVTPVNKSDESTTTVISKEIPTKTEKCSDNIVVILEDSSNEAIMKNEDVILIEDSSDEAENETMEHCPAENQKSDVKEDNENVKSNSEVETLHSENSDISNLCKILPPLNDSATLDPDEYVNEIKALEKNETPSEFYDFYLFVTKKQILNDQKPISFKIFLEFQNAGSLKAMEEAYKIYMIKSEKEK